MQFMTMREKEISTRAVGIKKKKKKKNGGNRTFKLIKQQYFSKNRQNVKQCMAFFPKLKVNYL